MFKTHFTSGLKFWTTTNSDDTTLDQSCLMRMSWVIIVGFCTHRSGSEIVFTQGNHCLTDSRSEKIRGRMKLKLSYYSAIVILPFKDMLDHIPTYAEYSVSIAFSPFLTTNQQFLLKDVSHWLKCLTDTQWTWVYSQVRMWPYNLIKEICRLSLLIV